ncbi:MAG: SagB/ThcOx family dehydrogenase [Theionarchaea archaeon]|nr:SagB/ThcOx family dehydrogenase [Theionarchaea archaeon]
MKYVWLLLFFCLCISQPPSVEDIHPESGITLPPPNLKGDMSVEESIRLRRSIRDFQDIPLSLEQISQLLWAGQGITEGFKRAAPSAGATYPLTLYVAVGDKGVTGLSSGVYEYIPRTHSLVVVKKGDFRQRIAAACLNQLFIQEAPVTIVIAAEYEKTTSRYGERGKRYVHMEAGHVGENIYLQAVALELGTVVVGAFQDIDLKQVLDLPEELVPLYVMPVGHPD